VTLPPLTIIPAGAGSGKTYSIQERLGIWVTEGIVAPERIMAVTFTEVAAGELRERIRSNLMRLGRIEEALKLDQAYISTIHGFGLRVLTEFAFDSGLSPRPRLLNEDEENALVRLALARTDKADVITSNLSGFGYKYDYSGKTAEEAFRDDLLGIVSRLRAVGWKAQSESYATNAVDWIKDRYGKTGNGDAITSELRERARQLLQTFPESLAQEYGTSKTATEALQKDFRNLHKALNAGELETNWNLWKELRSLRQTKRGAPLPDGYDELAAAVMGAADSLPNHPGPLQHAASHIEALLAAGQDVLVHYSDAKREAGLVDYSDMIAMAGEVLRSRPEILNTLVDGIDCLVIDEFQDTNPLQFALLWQLKEAGIPTVIVGDLKQAIMGFQGADPRLFEAIEQQNQEVSDPLTQNWRSQPHLMEFINAVGSELFDKEYVALEAQSKDSGLEPLESITFPKKAKKGQHLVRALSVGQRLKEIIEDEALQVIDRRTKENRRLRGGDIAVLCPTHSMCAEYAKVLRSQGLKVRLQEDGWFSSRAVQIAWYSLAYIANPTDRHAALYLAVTELGGLSLEEALRQLMDEGQIRDPLLDRLDAIAAGVADRTVYALVADTLSAINIFNEVSTWPNGEQARANLLRLLAEAGEYMDANREALAHGGFHGSGVQSFLAWLGVKVEAGDKNKQPDSRVLDENAVELVTWHSSKGREWPVVVVCGVDRSIGAKLPKMGLGYSSFDNLSKVLESAQIEYSPAFAASETNDRFLADLEDVAETESRRLLYVAITRAREKLILEWPTYLAGKDGLTYWSILANEVGMSLEDKAWKIGEALFPSLVLEGGSEVPEDLDLENAPVKEDLPIAGRRAIHHRAVSDNLTPDSVTPSGLGAMAHAEHKLELIVESYGDGLNVELDIKGVALGSFLHDCFEVLGAKLEFADRLSDIVGIQLDGKAKEDIGSCVKSFNNWLNKYFTPSSVAREQPLLAINENGSVVSGTADLVIETDDGLWVIDHKSDLIEDGCEAYNQYRSQLLSYANALASEGFVVLGVGINWIRKSDVVVEQLKN